MALGLMACNVTVAGGCALVLVLKLACASNAFRPLPHSINVYESDQGRDSRPLLNPT